MPIFLSFITVSSWHFPLFFLFYFEQQLQDPSSCDTCKYDASSPTSIMAVSLTSPLSRETSLLEGKWKKNLTWMAPPLWPDASRVPQRYVSLFAKNLSWSTHFCLLLVFFALLHTYCMTLLLFDFYLNIVTLSDLWWHSTISEFDFSSSSAVQTFRIVSTPSK